MNTQGHELFEAFHRIKKASMGRIHKSLLQNLKPHEFFMLSTLKKLLTEQAEEASNHQTDIPPGIKVSELSRVISISMPGVSQTISTLERHGYVKRIASKKDRRLVYVNLTDSGEQLEADVSKSCYQIYNEAALLLGEQDTQSLIYLLDKLTGAFDQIDHNQSDY
ncbi:MAG: MarR family transcriptional regulator [Firmicutes bacterium]|nr:MarR family transcriptional regulator [Bacillota bacterium]